MTPLKITKNGKNHRMWEKNRRQVSPQTWVLDIKNPRILAGIERIL